jgi:hypothetical protein
MGYEPWCPIARNGQVICNLIVKSRKYVEQMPKDIAALIREL